MWDQLFCGFGILLGLFFSFHASEDYRSHMGGIDVVHCVHLSWIHTACSCFRAYGPERDYVVSYSLCCTLVWCVRGLSYSTVSWAHLGNVTGVKSGELGVYYVTLFLQFGNLRLLARPGLCHIVRRGHNKGHHGVASS